MQFVRFQAHSWLRNPHAQTIWPALMRRRPALTLREEPLELPDGDVLRLVWGPEVPEGPLVIILHGLGGHAESGYVLGLMHALEDMGVAAVVMQFRGAGNWNNRLDRFYHAAAFDDLDVTANTVRQRFPDRPLAVAGFSLGASIILNWLADLGEDAPVQAAAVASPPFDLAACAQHIDQGFARLYQWDLLRTLKRMVRRKFQGRIDSPMDLRTLTRIRTLRDFDDCLTAPLHGFSGVDDYYTKASCGQRLDQVSRPTLIVHSEDDPFVPASTIPPYSSLSPQIEMEIQSHGGHVGFIAKPELGGMNWLDNRLGHYLADKLGASRPEMPPGHGRHLSHSRRPDRTSSEPTPDTGF